MVQLREYYRGINGIAVETIVVEVGAITHEVAFGTIVAKVGAVTHEVAVKTIVAKVGGYYS